MEYEFYNPSKIKIVKKNLFTEELIKIIKEKKVLLFISETCAKRIDFNKNIKRIKEHAEVSIINNINSNPTEKDIVKILNSLSEFKFDIILAVGGGSTIDIAKSVIALEYLINDETISDQIVKQEIQSKNYLNFRKKIDFIAVPTTAGTGSELTKWATVWDSQNKLKQSIEADWIMPNYLFIISEYMVTMSKRLTLTTALDSLLHATESYWSKKSNVITRELSKSSIKTIVKYLPKVLNEPENIYYREKINVGVVFSALAFSNTRTTLCHSISYPITMNYNIEHGFAAASTLVAVMKFNEENIVEIDELLEAYNAKDINDIKIWLDLICNTIQKINLRDFGIDRDELQYIAEASFTKGRADNNAKIATVEDVLKILNESY